MNKEKWTKEEIEFLKTNYQKIGADGCSKILNRSKNACKKKASKLEIRKNINRYEKIFLENIIKKSHNYTECLTKLNISIKSPGNYNLLKKYIKIYNLDISHFNRKILNTTNFTNKKIPLEEILVENSTYSRGKLKKRLYECGIKERKCELCVVKVKIGMGNI